MCLKQIEPFLELLRAGLWEKDVCLPKVKVDWCYVQRLAEEQAVVGLVAAGVDRLAQDNRPPKSFTLTVIGEALQIEQRNIEQNQFIEILFESLYQNGFKAFLVKGQGIAQCYEKPLWRSSGDVDLLLDAESYVGTKELLKPFASYVSIESTYKKHIAIHINNSIVELHGSLHSGISYKIDKGLDVIQNVAFKDNKYRIWCNNNTNILLPDPNTDVVFIFCHILQHFFKGGIGLRQICDWTRLLWKYRDDYDINLLNKRLRNLGILSEWKVFSSLVVDHLGLEPSAMPLYNASDKYKRKAKKVLDIVLETGNLGHNIDQTYRSKYPFIIRKLITFCRRIKEFSKFISIFPIDTPRFFVHYVFQGIKSPV